MMPSIINLTSLLTIIKVDRTPSKDASTSNELLKHGERMREVHFLAKGSFNYRKDHPIV